MFQCLPCPFYVEVLELKAGDSLRDAIHMLYEKDMFSAVIVDVLDPDSAASMRFSDRFIGFIDFASMVLWCLQVFSTFILRKSIP